MGEIKREIDILEELEINTFLIIYRSKALVGLEAKYNMKKMATIILILNYRI